LVLEGLELRPLGTLLDFLAANQFNAMRLLFNMQDWRDDPPLPPDNFSPVINPELVGMTYRGFLRHVTREAGRRGMLILLACHRLRRSYSDGIHAEWPTGWDGWWFDDKAGLPMAKVEYLWGEMAHLFCNEWNVFGAGMTHYPGESSAIESSATPTAAPHVHASSCTVHDEPIAPPEECAHCFSPQISSTSPPKLAGTQTRRTIGGKQQVALAMPY
jgi:hypothetical protein